MKKVFISQVLGLSMNINIFSNTFLTAENSTHLGWSDDIDLKFGSVFLLKVSFSILPAENSIK